MDLGEPTRDGLTRAGSGLAVLGLGTTIMFGAPIGYLKSVPEDWWPIIGSVLAVVGLILLVWGLVLLHLSDRRIGVFRREQRASSVASAQGTVREVDGAAFALQTAVDTARQYRDAPRLASLLAEQERDVLRRRAAEDVLRSFRINNMEPFEPVPNAAIKAVKSASATIEAARQGRADEWDAFVVETYWNDARAVAVLKPESVDARDIRVESQDGLPQQWRNGPGAIAVLADASVDDLIVYVVDKDGVEDRVELPLTPLM